MIIHKGVHMKRLIALLMVAAFCISIFATPASATFPDPNDPRFVRGGTPNGDEGGWGVPVDKSKDKSFGPFLFYRLNFAYPFSKFFIIRVIDNSDSQDRNDTESFTELSNNRRSTPE